MAATWTAGGAATELFNNRGPRLIKEVYIDGLAVLKIMKHCAESLPNMVSGSLLGLDQSDVLEITHSFALPHANVGANGPPAGDDTDGHDFQMDMMKMLREVNVDNNVVGWYQSMYLGSFCTPMLIENQFSYQDNLSDNSVVIMYDPVQTSNGSLTIKAYRLSREFMRVYRERKNEHIRPSEILEELPIRIRNPGIINALVYDMQENQRMDCDFERLDLSTNPYLEKNLEFLCNWIDDLTAEQFKFQQYTRSAQKQKQEQARWMQQRKRTNDDRRAAGEDPLPEDESFFDKKLEAPSRMESLLVANQISTYCAQINKFAGSSFEKLFLAGSLQKESS